MLGLGGRHVGLAPHANLIARLKKMKKKLAFCTLSDDNVLPASIYTSEK